MNCWTGLGRLTRDVDFKTYGATKVARVTIAVPNPKKSQKDGGPDAEFIPIKAFGRTAEVMAEYLSKGRQIAVTGHLESSSWDDPKTGAHRSALEVVVDNFDFISDGGGRQNSAPRQSAQPSYSRPQPQRQVPDDAFGTLEIEDDFSLLDDDEDIPF